MPILLRPKSNTRASRFWAAAFNRLVFYVVIVQTLTNWERISKFLGWWTAMVMFTAFLALAGEYFWDPLGSRAITHGAIADFAVVGEPSGMTLMRAHGGYVWTKITLMGDPKHTVFGEIRNNTIHNMLKIAHAVEEWGAGYEQRHGLSRRSPQRHEDDEPVQVRER